MGEDEEAQGFLGGQKQQQEYNGIWQRLRAWRTRLTRKHLAVAASSLLLLILLLLAISRHKSRSSHRALSSPSSTCSPARQNPHNVKAPLTPDVAKLTAFWPDLKRALDDHSGDLPTLEHPNWHPVFPTPEAIRDRTNLLNSTQAAFLREQHASYLSSLPAYPPKTFKGRGIVMLAGGHYSEYAATSLGVLRESGSTLPVEVWRRDEREEKHEWCDEIEAEGMACRRLSDYLDIDILSIADGKEMKVFTMLFSSFEEIIFIDADNMAIQAPDDSFESEDYRDTGAVLWNDFWPYDNADWLDYIAGISEDRSEALWETTTYESGQIIWDKKRHWKSLLLALYYNYHGPDLYYTLLNSGYAGWGDKDTFPLALRALNEPFHTIAHPPENVWVTGRIGSRRVGMLQMTPTPSSASSTGETNDENSNATGLFLHSTTIKWSHRDFLCDRCLPIWTTSSSTPTEEFVSRWEDHSDELSPSLHSNLRIIDPEVTSLTADGQDPEIRIWRAMEYAACRSQAWRHPRACEVGRRYMEETFGFRFEDRKGGVKTTPGMGEDVCLVDPS